jgi:hypothetical protein
MRTGEMACLQDPHDTGGRNFPPTESPESNQSDREHDTTGPAATANNGIELSNLPLSITAEVTTPSVIDGYTSEQVSSSHELADPEASLLQPEAKINFGWFLEKLGLTSTTFGFIVAVVIGAISWSGLNYANFYAKKSYDLALYQACRSYEVCSLLLSTKCL